MPKSRSRSRSHSRSRSRRVRRSKSHHQKGKVVPSDISSGRAKRLVYDGHYARTRSGLSKHDLVVNKHGKVVSRKKMMAGKKLQAKNPWKKNKAFLKYRGKIASM